MSINIVQNKKILVIGFGGQLASCLRKIVNNDYYFVGRLDCNVTNCSDITHIFEKINPSLVINCSAYTAVDLAEIEIKEAYKLNYLAVLYLAQLCSKKNIPLIHISSDYVFDGKYKNLYSEKEKPNPLSVYGQSKLAGEHAIQVNLDKYIILRTTWLFSEFGNNFVKNIINLSKTKDKIYIVDDQLGSPTYTYNIALIIKTIAEKILKDSNNNYGIYHYADYPDISWYDFAEIIFRILYNKFNHKIPEIKKISTIEYNSLAPRPLNSRFKCNLIEEKWCIKRKNWQENLEYTISKIINNKN